MSNYEIMLIIDPNSDDKIITEIANSTFKSKAKIEKLERTELAYEINKSKTANYYLINVNASGNEINEFSRKANIAKTIWRILSINLDSEKGLNRKAKPRKVKFNNFNKKSYNPNPSENQNVDEIKSQKAPKVAKSQKTTKTSLDKDKEEKSKKSTKAKKEKSE